MSEPGAGSDVGGLTCKATKTEDGWLVNGQKTWCSNAHISTHILLVARTSTGGDKHEGLTMFMVPTDVPGCRSAASRRWAARRSTTCTSPTACCRDAVVGVEGQGWRQLMTGLNLERMILAGLMLGLGRRAFDDTLAYVREREQFGRAIGCSRRCGTASRTTRPSWPRRDCSCTTRPHHRREPTTLFPREARWKLKATELAKHLSLEGMQMLGGYGYATEYGMERLLRQSVVSTVYGGTSEIQRDVIGKSFGL